MARRSGLQQQIINLYRECFRAAKEKPVDARPRFQAFIRQEFRKHDIRKNDFATIEYMLRKGERQLKTYRKPTMKDIHV
ncbi:hypothetical protein DM01DRAFT_1378000 [Hesseltinella vesiculosa]|uniref:Complex 1 LYR protein domain-containing protein n=1 Tax=Hesseltinella vesiculosa TaxID=101127 RepID=A0A1X2G6V0_9FUNG|nr:hypothetical protein DM01DRAFT_1378000 [Hesseltinella vesiculosa]